MRVAIAAFPARKFRPAKLNLSPNEIRSVSELRSPSTYTSSGDLLFVHALYSQRVRKKFKFPQIYLKVQLVLTFHSIILASKLIFKVLSLSLIHI